MATEPDTAAPHPPDPDPRYVLAAERTFLAWQRTALALIAVGLAAAELLPSADSAVTTVLGFVLVVAGGALSAGSFVHHRVVDRAIVAHRAIPSTRLTGLLAVVTLLATVVAVVLLLAADG